MAEKMRFKSVAEASAFLAVDDTVKNLVQDEIDNSQIVNNLLQLRLRKGVSQKKLSKSMGCATRARYQELKQAMICS
jgi:hypothetical protein